MPASDGRGREPPSPRTGRCARHGGRCGQLRSLHDEPTRCRGRTYGRPPPRRPQSTPVQRTRTIPCPSGSPVATRAVVPAGVRVPGGGLPAGGATRPAERPPGIRLSQIRDEVTDLRETHDLTPRRLRRVIWPVGFGVAGCGSGKPPRITKPPTHRPYRRDDGITPHPRRTQLKDHTTRMLTRSKPPFSLNTKPRPRIRPRTRPGRRPPFRDTTQMSGECRAVSRRKDPGCTPHPRKFTSEHLSLTHALIRVASVLLTQHNAHPMRQIMGCDTPTPRTRACTQRTHRMSRCPPPPNPTP